MEAKSQAVKRLEEIKDGMVFQTSKGGWKLAVEKNVFFFPDPKVFCGRVEKSEDFFFGERISRTHIHIYIYKIRL